MKNRRMHCTLLLTVLLIIGFLFTSLVSYFTAHESIKTQMEKTTLPLTSDNIYSEIQKDLLQPIVISSMMANDTFVRNWVVTGERDEEKITSYLKEIQTQYNAVTSFFVSEKTRKYYHSSGVLRKVDQYDSQDNWYFRTREMSTDYEINVDIDTADTSSLAVFLNHRMYNNSGEYIGTIGIGLAMNTVQASIEYYKKQYDRQVYFIDNKGAVTLHGLYNHLPKTIHQIPELAKFTTQILNTPNNAIAYEKKGSTHYINTRFIPEFNWYLVIEQQEEVEGKKLQNTLILNLAISLFISIIMIILVIVIISGYQKKIEVIATTDKLTGVANRQLFDILFKQAYTLSKRHHRPLAAIMFDVDYFKQINDTYGHPEGDVVLKSLAQLIKRSIRGSDSVFRWGGEEFLVLLPESDVHKATLVAENIRKEIANQKITLLENTISITVSAGVSSTQNKSHANDLVTHADKALYLAKNNGRNRVEYYPA